ncbi:hypothetical protein MKW94_003250 [Papaver nudicaule]|uniref:chlorophyllase n=1 Tax=Papaver nudicaule TaxID=74823 RepID=A0AA41VB66_PAPNU|nr:hypothetical protein [Papaver nudicaule]
MTLTMSSPSSTRNVFELGAYTVCVLQVDPKSCARTTSSSSSSLLSHPLTKSLLIATPTEKGEFPILVFLHGFLLYNSFYSQLIQHIASHGFIVIAPQLYNCAGPDSSDEIKSAAAVTEWLSDGLSSVLPPAVLPNLTKAALAGHSRGGKVAFALALSYSSASKSGSTNSLIKYSVLMGIDPVDGMDKGKQTPPPVLTYVPRSFDVDMAALVVGSGLGEIKKNRFFPPCAPKGVNHEDFYNECQSPACYFVVKDYGHTDMLDDETKGIRGKLSHCTCKSGKTREPMRRFVGGIMVAFMKAYLEGDPSYLNAIKDGKETRNPVELQTVEFLV